MSRIAKRGKRSETRDPVSDQQKIHLSINFRDDLQPSETDVEAVDISPGGIGLLVRSSLPIHKAVTLRLNAPDANLDLKVDALICWMRPAGEELWRFGCVFKSRLSDDILHSLAISGYVQRRRDRREPVDLTGTAQWEVTSRSFPIRVLNFSAGGLCVACSESGSVGDRLLIHLDPQDGHLDKRAEPILVKAEWQARAGGATQIGCAFSHKDGSRIVRERLLANSPDYGA